MRRTAGCGRLHGHVSAVGLEEKKAGPREHARSHAWVSIQLDEAKKRRAMSQSG